MASAWKSSEDFENDLWAFSEINDDGETHDPPPRTILQYNAELRANSNTSIFDTDYSDEPVIYLSTGRGRGGISQMFRPGLTVRNEHEHSVQKYIRQVSGLGYSNELIEKSFKKSTPQPIEEFCDAENDSSNKFSTLDQTDRLKVTSSLSSSKESLSNRISTPVGEDTVETPLPLSVMLCQAKKNTKTDKHNTVRKKEYTLNPEAPEFKVLDFNQNRQSNVLDESSHKSKSPESDNIESCSSGDEPSRKKINNRSPFRKNGVHSGRDFTRNSHFNSLLLDDGTFERNMISWRQKDQTSFNVNSINDFPPL